jgi:pyrimidine operon attenuation protein/uracil phosphoribosyltransferase
MLVLNNDQIQKKIHRLAYQIYESFLEEKELVVAGINGNGYELAKILCTELQAVSPIRCILVEILIDKQQPSAAGTQLKHVSGVIGDKPVLIVDDVLNTGKTMVYAVSSFIREGSGLIRTVVLADRNHKKFPISADFVGISMATTLQEHLQFSIGKKGYLLELQ